MCANGDNKTGTDTRDFGAKGITITGNLLCGWRMGRKGFDQVRDPAVVAGQARQAFETGPEFPTGRADEAFAAQVFFTARTLTTNEECRLRIATARNDLGHRLFGADGAKMVVV